MKKKMLIFALLLVTGTSLGVSAQCQRPASCGKTEQCVAPQRNGCENPFEGINLTVEQKGELDALKSKCNKRCENDKSNAGVKRKEARRNHLKEVKAILTPEQYVVFLENIVVSQREPRRSNRPDAPHRKMAANKCGKDCTAAQCPASPK